MIDNASQLLGGGVVISKNNYIIKQISKSEASELLIKYHYLTHRSKNFKSGINYGCFTLQNELVGVAIFTGLSVPELAKGMFGLAREEQNGLFELSRFCLTPKIQKTEHNLASWFLSRSIKLLRKSTDVRAILSYADSDFHIGTIYAACNFKYYGLTAPKKDFYIKNPNGTFTKHSRGKIKGLEGEWRYRSRKHRFVIIFDKTLKIKWTELKYKDIKPII